MGNTYDERTWIIVWAVGQGSALLLLHEWVKAVDQPDQLLWLIWPIYALAVWLPTSLQVLARHRREPALWRILAGFAAALATMAVHDGWTVFEPDTTDRGYWSGSAFILGLTTAACWFILLPFAQYRLQQGRWGADYAFLFSASWRNALQLSSAAGFAGVFWILLALWAALFNLLGVHFFADLFTSRRFAYPVTALVFGLGLSLYQMRETAILGVYHAALNILGWLLPLAAVLAVGFLAALPFTGLQPLWKTGHATALMLGLQGFVLFLFNAAWQDGTGEPLPPRWLRRPLAWAIALLPVYAALCAYSLGLRVSQYGWSGERVWAALLVFIIGFYGLGYARAALDRGEPWMAWVARVNVAAALILVTLLFATATPLLDPERIGVASQVGRLLSGKVKPAEFDYHYLRFDTGRPGTKALQRLTELDGTPEAGEIRQKAVAAQKQKNKYRGQDEDDLRTDWTPEEISARVHVYPAGAKAEESFLRFLTRKINAAPDSFPCLKGNSGHCILLVLDLNGDGAAEQVMVSSSYAYAPDNIFQWQGEAWSSIGQLTLRGSDHLNMEDLDRDLATGKLRVLEPEWRDVEIGGRRYGVVMR
jgi:hypothetical protein